jgi:hypothetical protein
MLQFITNNPDTVEELQQGISAALISVSEETSCSCAKFPTSATDGLGRQWNTY